MLIRTFQLSNKVSEKIMIYRRKGLWWQDISAYGGQVRSITVAGCGRGMLFFLWQPGSKDTRNKVTNVRYFPKKMSPILHPHISYFALVHSIFILLVNLLPIAETLWLQCFPLMEWIYYQQTHLWGIHHIQVTAQRWIYILISRHQ